MTRLFSLFGSIITDILRCGCFTRWYSYLIRAILISGLSFLLIFFSSLEKQTHSVEIFFSTIVSALRLAAVLVASLLWLRIRFHIFSTVFCGSMSNWKQVYCIARLAIDNKTNKWRTNEKKNYEFSCKEFFPCRCIHWKSCLSNSFDTYE